jgi:hypothetical protein
MVVRVARGTDVPIPRGKPPNRVLARVPQMLVEVKMISVFQISLPWLRWQSTNSRARSLDMTVAKRYKEDNYELTE